MVSEVTIPTTLRPPSTQMTPGAERLQGAFGNGESMASSGGGGSSKHLLGDIHSKSNIVVETGTCKYNTFSGHLKRPFTSQWRQQHW